MKLSASVCIPGSGSRVWLPFPAEYGYRADIRILCIIPFNPECGVHISTTEYKLLYPYVCIRTIPPYGYSTEHRSALLLRPYYDDIFVANLHT